MLEWYVYSAFSTIVYTYTRLDHTRPPPYTTRHYNAQRGHTTVGFSNQRSTALRLQARYAYSRHIRIYGFILYVLPYELLYALLWVYTYMYERILNMRSGATSQFAVKYSMDNKLQALIVSITLAVIWYVIYV
jgi:hypothetical protein